MKNDNLNFEYLYDTHFREFEKYQKDKEFFKSELENVLKTIYEDIEFSNLFFRRNCNGIEIDYKNDIEKFNRDIKKFEKVFIGCREIKEPYSLTYILTTAKNYLTHLEIKPNIIEDVFDVIISEYFKNTNKSPSLSKRQTKLIKDFEDFIDNSNKMQNMWEQHIKENPNKNFKELLTLFTKK